MMLSMLWNAVDRAALRPRVTYLLFLLSPKIKRDTLLTFKVFVISDKKRDTSSIIAGVPVTFSKKGQYTYF